MTEPTVPRPVPAPYRPAPRPAAVDAPDATSGPGAAPDATSAPVDSPVAAAGSGAPHTDVADASLPGGAQEGADARRGLSGLDELPVAEHVAVFEAEHARLQRELGTIDPR